MNIILVPVRFIGKIAHLIFSASFLTRNNFFLSYYRLIPCQFVWKKVPMIFWLRWLARAFSFPEKSFRIMLDLSSCSWKDTSRSFHTCSIQTLLLAKMNHVIHCSQMQGLYTISLTTTRKGLLLIAYNLMIIDYHIWKVKNWWWYSVFRKLLLTCGDVKLLEIKIFPLTIIFSLLIINGYLSPRPQRVHGAQPRRGLLPGLHG